MNVVTGAFGYIGRYITRQLLDSGQEVKTITTHPDKPNPFGEAVQAFPYDFDHPERLVESLRGVEVLYNTYWIRFEHGLATFSGAVQNTRTLFECAQHAGVRRIVHISVTNPDPDCDLPYYRGKALQERSLQELDLSYSIVRPTLVFGVEDILVNNIAWLMRTFPLFPIFGSGEYRLQPVFVGDLAQIAVEEGGAAGDKVIDAVGPETFTYEGMVQLMGSHLKPNLSYTHMPAWLGVGLGKIIGLAVGDVILTRDEAQGLMEERLTSSQPPNGSTKFSEWIASHKDEIGLSYTSEMKRHFNWMPRPDDK